MKKLKWLKKLVRLLRIFIFEGKAAKKISKFRKLKPWGTLRMIVGKIHYIFMYIFICLGIFLGSLLGIIAMNGLIYLVALLINVIFFPDMASLKYLGVVVVYIILFLAFITVFIIYMLKPKIKKVFLSILYFFEKFRGKK